MKIYGSKLVLAALCVLHPWGTTAFLSPQAPKAKLSPSFPYLGSLDATPNDDDAKTTSNPESKTSALPPSAASLVASGKNANEAMKIWDTSSPVLIQGNSLKTWSFPSTSVERVRVSMKTDGRPLNANMELWHGPDYTATKTKIYIEDGSLRPFNAVVATPKGMNTIALYNIGNMEFPFSACVEADAEDGSTGLAAASKRLSDMGVPKTVQGGSITSYPFDPSVESVQVLLKTDGRNLKARIELMQGPNNDKQVIEFYSTDGKKRPFFAVIEAPGSGNVIRLINENTVEFPFSAWVGPYVIDNTKSVSMPWSAETT